MSIREITKFLEAKPGYSKWGNDKLADYLAVSVAEVIAAKAYIRTHVTEAVDTEPTYTEDQLLEMLKKVKEQPVQTTSPLTSKLVGLPKPFKGDINNVLVIGDLHAPFILDGYLEHCRAMQEKFNCGKVIFIGDVIDNHFSSYHETDPDGYSAGDELDRAIDDLQCWYKVFPKADVIIGNHDRMVFRKAYSAGVSKRWVRAYDEVLETPGWNFVEEVIIDNVCYNHGEGGTARRKMKDESMSQVQGHLHSQAYIEYSVGKTFKVFGFQVGCGVDKDSYAMAYGKQFKRPVVSCGVVINKGTLPILLPMEL